MNDSTAVTTAPALDDRIAQVRAGRFDAAILALAGLQRLDRAADVAQVFPIDMCVPAPGQATLVVQARADNARLCAALQALDHPPTRALTDCERTLQHRYESADWIVAASAQGEATIHLIVILLAVDGSTAIRARQAGTGIATVMTAVQEQLDRQLADLGALHR